MVNNQARTLFSVGEKERAYAMLYEAIAAQTEEMERKPHYGLFAELYFMDHLSDSALHYYEKSFPFDPYERTRLLNNMISLCNEMGDYEKATPWSENGVRGCKRFLDRVWALQDVVTDGDGLSADMTAPFHRTIKKVTEDIEGMKFNTAIAALMTLLNQIADKGSLTRGELKIWLGLLNPFAPHITEEMWQAAGFAGRLVTEPWPEYDEAKCADATVEIAVQVNGKVRTRITVAADIAAPEAIAAAKADDKIAAALAGMTVVKELYVPGKLVNLVVKPN